jgi:hypothetical protein
MTDERDLAALAEIWIARYGKRAPEQIRQWALDPAQSAEAAEFLQRIAQAAEGLLAKTAPGDKESRDKESRDKEPGGKGPGADD